MKPVEPTRHRGDGAVDMLSTLRREVEISERRLALATDMLKRYLLSHGDEVLDK
jgi:hypothetical protein